MRLAIGVQRYRHTGDLVFLHERLDDLVYLGLQRIGRLRGDCTHGQCSREREGRKAIAWHQVVLCPLSDTGGGSGVSEK
ncbi:hypothetical protein D3C78_1699780 [compost metagenome]